MPFARALYACEGEGPGELTFNAGDKLKVTSKSVPSLGEGWWSGSVVGQKAQGNFPANYVESIATPNRPSARPSMKPKPAARKGKGKGKGKGKSGGRPAAPPNRPKNRPSSRPSVKPKPASRQPRSAAASSGGSADAASAPRSVGRLPDPERRVDLQRKYMVSTKANYTAGDPDEISFAKKQKVEVVAVAYQGDAAWWIGCCRQRFGKMPAKLLQVSASVPTHNLKCPTSAAGVGKMMIAAKCDYAGKRSRDEIRLKQGDMVEVICKEFRGTREWWFGRCDKKWGCFPRKCVVAAPSRPVHRPKANLSGAQEVKASDRGTDRRSVTGGRSESGPGELSGASKAKARRQQMARDARRKKEADAERVNAALDYAAAHPGEEPIGSGRALYDCQGEGAGELTFREGDVIAITAMEVPSQGDGWMNGYVQGSASETGYFPANYIQVEQMAAKSRPSFAAAAPPRAARPSVKPKPRARKGKTSAAAATPSLPSRPASRPSRTSISAAQRKSDSAPSRPSAKPAGGRQLNAKQRVKQEKINKEKARLAAIRAREEEEDRLAQQEAEEEEQELRLAKKRMERNREKVRKQREREVAEAEAELVETERLERERLELEEEEAKVAEESKRRKIARERKREATRLRMEAARKEAADEEAAALAAENERVEARLARVREREAKAEGVETRRKKTASSVRNAARASAVSRKSLAPSAPSRKPKARSSIAPPPRRAEKSQSRVKMVAVALYDCDGEGDEDLIFREGDTIEVLETNLPDVGEGWWNGRIYGHKHAGNFPSTYVEKQGSSSSSSSSSSRNSTATVLVARALYDCDGEGDGELSFSAGDMIDVTATEVPDLGEGWWCGRIRGTATMGNFPSNYVQEVSKSAPSRASVAVGGKKTKKKKGGLLGGLLRGKKKKKKAASFEFEIKNVEVRHVTRESLTGGGSAAGPPPVASRKPKGRGSSGKGGPPPVASRGGGPPPVASRKPKGRKKSAPAPAARSKKTQRKSSGLSVERLRIQRLQEEEEEADRLAAEEEAELECETARLKLEAEATRIERTQKEKGDARRKKKEKKLRELARARAEVEAAAAPAMHEAYVAVDGFEVRALDESGLLAFPYTAAPLHNYRGTLLLLSHHNPFPFPF